MVRWWVSKYPFDVAKGLFDLGLLLFKYDVWAFSPSMITRLTTYDAHLGFTRDPFLESSVGQSLELDEGVNSSLLDGRAQSPLNR